MSIENTQLRCNTPIVYMGMEQGNKLYIKRDDLVPYSFGGNKARKGVLFFEEIEKGGYDCVVTYGSSHSNHCRIISNMAAARGLLCFIIGPSEVADSTFNSKFMKLFGADIKTVPINEVHDTIKEKIEELRNIGKKPFFIPGGGHGNIGTEAYVRCYEEIREYEMQMGVKFSYIFFASGTGTTQAGLICGQIKNHDDRQIVGISIARKNPRGRNIVIDSIKEYMPGISDDEIQKNTLFVDNYIGDGYGAECKEIREVIKDAMIRFGLPLDSTYTGKAFLGMKKYIDKERISGSHVLFIHTGGTPLFFDDFRKM